MTNITVRTPTLDDWEEEDISLLTPMPCAGYSLRSVKELTPTGPWVTKSQAELSVPLSLDVSSAMYHFLRFDARHQKDPDIRGLRMYRVSGIPEGTIGGTEFHRQRQEMVWCIRGKIKWVCEDIYGATKEYILEDGKGVWMPPFILHTYTALHPDSDLLILCNTTFNAQDPRTHDTWPTDVFEELQQQIRLSSYWDKKKNAPARDY